MMSHLRLPFTSFVIAVLVPSLGSAGEPNPDKRLAQCVSVSALVFGPDGTKDPAPLTGALILDRDKRLILAPSTNVPDAPTVVFPAYTTKGELRNTAADYSDLWKKGKRWAGKVVHRDKARDLAVIELALDVPEGAQAAGFSAKSVPIGSNLYALNQPKPDKGKMWELSKGAVRYVGIEELLLAPGSYPAPWPVVVSNAPRGAGPDCGLFDSACRVIGFPCPPAADGVLIHRWLDVTEIRAFLTDKKVPFRTAPSAAELLVGQWLIEKSTVGGMDSTPPPGSTVTFKTDGVAIIRDGKRGKDEPNTYKTDATKDPPELDITPRGETIPSLRCIYKVDGDTLTVCVTTVGDRPKRFESPEGTEIRLITMKRMKPKE